MHIHISPNLARAATLTVLVLGACGGDDPTGAPPAGVPDGGGASSSSGGAPVDGGNAEDSGSALEPLDRAGTRLAPRYAVSTGSDGSKARSLLGFYDHERDEPCEIGGGADGTMRCTPLAASPEVGFTDAACTHAVWRFTPQTSCNQVDVRPRAVILYDPESPACAVSPLLEYPKTTPLEVAAGAQFYEQRGGECVAARVGQAGDEVFDAPAAPVVIEPAALVLLTPSERVEGTGRIQVLRTVYDGSDGSRGVLAYDGRTVDTERHELCYPSQDGAGASRCLPGALNGNRTAYSDATCDAASLLRGGSKDGSPHCGAPDPRDTTASYLIVSPADGGACSLPDRFARPTSTPYSGALYAQSDASCSALTPDPNVDYWTAAAFGSPLERSLFAPAALEQLPSPPSFYATPGTRLEIRQFNLTQPGAAPVPYQPGGFVERDTGLECSRYVLDDGRKYCVSALATLTPEDQFADAACSVPAVSIVLYTNPCVTTPIPEPKLLVDQATDACGAHHAFRVPAAALTGTGFHLLGVGECLPLDPPGPDAERRLYLRSDLQPYDASTLVSITTTDEHD